jgi:RNA polymerase sigma factor (sigma-70 family)
MIPSELDNWFVDNVLPLEASLMRFLRRNWREEEDMLDLRQDIYVRIYESAARGLPDLVKPFVFTTARNLLIDRARHAKIVLIEAIADLDALELWVDDLTPERHASGRMELRRLQRALECLPPRCRLVVEMRKIEGLSQRDVAARLGITEDTVERQVANGMRALADALLADGLQLSTKLFIAANSRKQWVS